LMELSSSKKIDWMSPIKAYLDNQPISEDNVEIERIAPSIIQTGRQWHDDEVYF
jgi:hypothetical protein